jgi:hypothetical protein
VLIFAPSASRDGKVDLQIFLVRLEGASLDLLAAAYQQRVLWAEAHADSSFRRIIAMMAGFFGPPANQHPVI